MNRVLKLCPPGTANPAAPARQPLPCERRCARITAQQAFPAHGYGPRRGRSHDPPDRLRLAVRPAGRRHHPALHAEQARGGGLLQSGHQGLRGAEPGHPRGPGLQRRQLCSRAGPQRSTGCCDARLRGTETAEFVRKGIFADLSGLPVARTIDPKFQDLVNSWGQYNGNETSALPFSIAAAGVVYNRDIFAAHGVAVPTTWDDFVAACETFKAAGITPIYGTFKDAWTLRQGAFDYVTGGMLDVGAFFKDLMAKGAKITEGAPEAFSNHFSSSLPKILQLSAFSQSGAASKNYADGNAAFGKGQAAMYLQGPWALSQLVQANKDIRLGTFPLPVTNNPERDQGPRQRGHGTLHHPEHPQQGRRGAVPQLPPGTVGGEHLQREERRLLARSRTPLPSAIPSSSGVAAHVSDRPLLPGRRNVLSAVSADEQLHPVLCLQQER